MNFKWLLNNITIISDRIFLKPLLPALYNAKLKNDQWGSLHFRIVQNKSKPLTDSECTVNSCLMQLSWLTDYLAAVDLHADKKNQARSDHPNRRYVWRSLKRLNVAFSGIVNDSNISWPIKSFLQYSRDSRYICHDEAQMSWMPDDALPPSDSEEKSSRNVLVCVITRACNWLAEINDKACQALVVLPTDCMHIAWASVFF